LIISIVQLGTVDYSTALRLQQRLVDLRKNNQIANVLLLLEHAPVITLGRNATRKNVLASDELLKQRGVELFECDRGGDVTYHGPGQLVGYPIFDLRSFLGPDGQRKTLGAVDYVRRLEEALVRTCADYGVPTERVAGMTGVWTQLATSDGARSPSIANGQNNPLMPVIPSGANDPELVEGERAKPRACPELVEGDLAQQAKIAAIGVHISRGVTSHGFALNVTSQPLEYFQLIVPCGISSKPVTSLERELDRVAHAPGSTARAVLARDGVDAPSRVLSLDEVAQSVARNFGRVFSSQIVWVDSLDALLGRSVGVPARAPEELRKIAGEDDTFWA
jgi:lipoyl(octanoyl) transferase